ncbi:MAG: hypothetical protein WBG18_14350 [Xanthobacteraceae bacterium]
MNEFSGAPYSDEAILTVDVSDEAIESAASAAWGKKRAALTLAFCSRIDTCPMRASLR